MTTYLLNYLLEWTLSLAVLLGVYKLLLENQAVHSLKRVYLIGTLLVPLAIPLITVEVSPGTLPVEMPTRLIRTQTAPEKTVHRSDDRLAGEVMVETAPATVSTEPAYPSVVYVMIALYGLVAGLMLARFGRNLYRLRRQVRTNPTELLSGARLVRLPGEGLPYTFLNYLFVSDVLYSRGGVEPELLTHELAHIRQRHSIDVLLVEAIHCFGWFNPLLPALKQAMQLNHEFLADQVVNTAHLNVPDYQRLLLSKLSISPPLALTSTLTFQTTKQRLLMMTKSSSSVRRCLTTAGTALLFATLTVVMTARTVAQQVPAPTKPTAVATPLVHPKYGKLTEEEIVSRYGTKEVELWENGKSQKIQYRDLTPAQKKWVYYVPLEPRIEPTEAQWNDWQNTKKYGLWVDGKRRRDNPMDTKYKRTDIVYFWSSYVYKNARQPEGYSYQLELYTEPAYQQMLKRHEEAPFIVSRLDWPRQKKTAR